MNLALAAQVRRAAVQPAPKRLERPVPEAAAVGVAGAAGPPGPAAAEPVARAREQVASSPYESAEPTRAPARPPANPCRTLTGRQPVQRARRVRGEPLAPEARAAAAAARAEQAAPARRRQPEEQPAGVGPMPEVQVLRAQVPAARAKRLLLRAARVLVRVLAQAARVLLPAAGPVLARAAQVLLPAAGPVLAPGQAGCSWPEALCRGRRPVTCPTGPCRTATKPAWHAQSGVRAAMHPAPEARAWSMAIGPRQASPARWAGRRARHRSWGVPVAPWSSATLG
jgi:hypothetical protein